MGSRLSQHSRLCERAKTEKKGGGIVCGTQKSDRSSSFASAEIKVCSRAVLPGRGRAEHQKIGPLPQPRTKITTPGNNLVSSSQETFSAAVLISTNFRFHSALFQQPRLITTVIRITSVKSCHG